MNENEMKKAFDEIEPEAGAQERMYANILKKAAAQKENQAFAKEIEINDVPQKHRTIPLWRWGSLAACFAIVVAVSLTLPKLFAPAEQDPPPVMAGSPIQDVSGAQDFETLGFTIDAPNGAEHISYCILDGEIAQVSFSLEGYQYTYRAAMLDGDFSGTNGEAIGSISLDAKYDAVLDRLPLGVWRAHWNRDGISFYLTSGNGADEKAVTAVVKALLEKN